MNSTISYSEELHTELENSTFVTVNYTSEETVTYADWYEVLKRHAPLASGVDRFITPIWYVLGITGNTLAAIIWLKRQMRRNNSSAIYLATLSIVDLLFLLMHIFIELRYAWNIRSLSFPVFCEGYFVFYMAAQYLSPLLVLGFTVERWIAVCKPFVKEQYCTEKRAIIVVIGLVVLSLSLCVIQMYFWEYDPQSNDCVIQVEGESSLFSVWTWTTELAVFLVVPMVILNFNILVIHEVRKVSRNGHLVIPAQARHKSATTTAMLLTVSFYVIVTTLPATLVYCLGSQFQQGSLTLTHEEIERDPTWRRHHLFMTVRKIIEEICLSHYACNFVLYTVTGQQFRKALIEMLKYPIYKVTKKTKYAEITRLRPDNRSTQTRL